VRVYPNGKLDSAKDRMDIEVVLVDGNKSSLVVDAECHWTLVNKAKMENYAGGIKRQEYRVSGSGLDDSFDNSPLVGCPGECIITIGIMQFIKDDDEDGADFIKKNASIITAGEALARNQISDNEEDFQKTISNPLY
jgi:hypothetical protein